MNGPTISQRIQDLETNPTLLSFYTKSKCKQCLGRGKVTRSLRGPFGFVNQESICKCVYDNLHKEMRSNG
jgi:hypothetical protein